MLSPRSRAELTNDLGRLAAGDREAFARAFEVLWPVVRAFVARQVAAPDADDVAQEALVRLFARCAEFDPARGEALTWALGIAAFETRTANKRRSRRREEHRPPPEGPAAGPSAETALVDADLLAAAREVIGGLGPADAATLEALASGRRPDIPGATFRKRLERALRRFGVAWRIKHGSD